MRRHRERNRGCRCHPHSKQGAHSAIGRSLRTRRPGQRDAFTSHLGRPARQPLLRRPFAADAVAASVAALEMFLHADPLARGHCVVHVRRQHGSKLPASGRSHRLFPSTEPLAPSPLRPQSLTQRAGIRSALYATVKEPARPRQPGHDVPIEMFRRPAISAYDNPSMSPGMVTRCRVRV